MLLMAEKEVRGGICYSVLRYTNANSKYMKNYNQKNKLIISNTFRWKKTIWLRNFSKITSRGI